MDLKKKIVTMLLLFCLLIFLIAYFVIFPAIKDIVKIREEIEFQRMELERKYQKGQNLRSISEKLARAEEKIDNLCQIFIEDSEGLKFVTTIEDIADKNKVTQKINLAAEPVSSNGYYKVFPLQLFSQGSIKNQLNYLIGLETTGYYINIKSLEISSGSGEAIPLLNELSENASRSVNVLISSDTFWR